MEKLRPHQQEGPHLVNVKSSKMLNIKKCYILGKRDPAGLIPRELLDQEKPIQSSQFSQKISSLALYGVSGH